MPYPPLPQNISIPAVIAGNILQNDDTSISAVDSGYDGMLVVRTDNKVAMIINNEQKVSINSENPSKAALTINNNVPDTPTLRMSYKNEFYFDGRITENGSTVFIPSCDDDILNPRLTTAFKKNFDVMDHDGMQLGLRLGGTLISASASELNYVDVPAGVAKDLKAMVLDINSSITGVNNFGATTISGTITTPNQPNIKTLKDVDITGTLRVKGAEIEINPALINLLSMPFFGSGIASKAMILDANRNFDNINHLTATTLTGTLTTGPQPGITALSALNSLTNNGPSNLNSPVYIQAPTGDGDQLILRYSESASASLKTNENGSLVLGSTNKRIIINLGNSLVIPSHDSTARGLILGDQPVFATGTQLNYTSVVPGAAEAEKALVIDANKNIRGVNLLIANGLTGTLITEYQPLIAKVDVLDIKSHDSSSKGLMLGGQLVKATAAELNYVDTTPGIAEASKAIILNSTKDISGINTLSATTLAGTLSTADQPSLRTVRTLTISEHDGSTRGLTLGTTLITVSGEKINSLDTTMGRAAASKVMILDGNLNYSGVNIFSANTLNGTVKTAAQPYINQVNTLEIASHNGSSSGLSLNGTLVIASAAELNRLCIDPGTSFPNKAMILDSLMSIQGINVLSANTLAGTLTTPIQPNIQTVRTLNIQNHDGTTTGLSLNGDLVTATAHQLNFVDVSPGEAKSSSAVVLSAEGSVAGIKALTAEALYGVIKTSSQPFIASVNKLDIAGHDGESVGLSLAGNLITVSANDLNRMSVEAGVATGGKALVVDGTKNIQGINTLRAEYMYGLLKTSSQPGLTSVSTLNIEMHNGTTGLALNGNVITASAGQLNRVDTAVGIASPGKAMILDSTKSIDSIGLLSADRLSGELQTEYQPKLTSVNTFNVKNHDGRTSGLKLGDALVVATASQLNYTAATPGKATIKKALVTDDDNSIEGINNLRASKVFAEQISLSGIVANFNTGGIILKTYSFTELTGRIVDMRLLSALSFNGLAPAGQVDSFSSEMIGYIKPVYSENYTFYITCNDRVRLWVNGELILHSWVKPDTPTARFSTTIFLNADQWVPIYIQYQVDSGSTPYFLLEWTSTNTARGQIPPNFLAWDSNPPAATSKHSTQNSLLIYNTATTFVNSAKLTVDAGGDLTIDSSGNDIILGAADNLSIPSHDGATKGLILGGVLVQPTATEINYLKVNPGKSVANKAMVLDANRSIDGIASLTATTIACADLQTDTFTIDNLTLPGPLNNYKAGSLLIRQITGGNASGRVVFVDTIEDLNISNYDPKELATNFSLDICGYILPQYTENHKFYAIADDRVRIWVNNTLVLNAWPDIGTGLEYTSTPIALTAGQWVPIYIQFQNVTGLSSLQVRWSSTSLIKTFISNSYMAWDNTVGVPLQSVNSANRISVYNNSAGLNTPQTAAMSVDANGNMILSATSNVVMVNSSNNFNVASHNGTTGLQLAGTLVKATAAEINLLAGSIPGTATSSGVLTTNDQMAIGGLSAITSAVINGVIKTAAQPYITSLGTLASTLSSTADVVVGSNNRLRLASDSNGCYIQAGSSSATDSAADIYIGNYGTDATTSSRRMVVKADGNVGIQTTVAPRPLTVNGTGAPFMMRLNYYYNGNQGDGSRYCELGCDTNSNFCIGSNVIIGTGTSTAAITVNESGSMKLSPSSGSVQIGNTNAAAMPLELGFANFTLGSECGYINGDGSMGRTTPSATTYSMRTAGSIIVGGTVCITSDRRLKHEIKKLSTEKCKRFILESNPVSFKYKNAPTTHCGLIAQEVAKSDFATIVKAAPHEGLIAEDDSPADAALNVSYEEIIPILMTTMKQTLAENEQLKQRVDRLELLLQKLTQNS